MEKKKTTKTVRKKKTTQIQEAVGGQMASDRTQRIAEKAFELYEKRGRVQGSELNDWLEAEKLVQNESE